MDVANAVKAVVALACRMPKLIFVHCPEALLCGGPLITVEPPHSHSVCFPVLLVVKRNVNSFLDKTFYSVQYSTLCTRIPY